MSIAKKIQDLRQEKGWSQAELGKKAGVNQRYVSTWETSKNVPQFDSLIKLSRVFEVSIDYLIFDNVPRQGISAIGDFELYEYFQQADALPEEEKRAIKQLVSAMVFRNKVKTAEQEAQEAEPRPKIIQPALRKLASKR